MSRKMMGSIVTAALGVAVAGYMGVAHSQASPVASPSPMASPTAGAGSVYYLDTFGYANDGSTSPTDTPGAASLIGPLTLGTGGTVGGTLTLTYANVSGLDSCPLTVASGSTITNNGDGTATLLLNVGGTNPIEFTVLDIASAAAGTSVATSGGTTTGGTTTPPRRGGAGSAASPGASPTPSGGGASAMASSGVDLMVVQTATTSSGALGIPCGGVAGPIVGMLVRGDMSCRPGTGATATAGGATATAGGAGTSCALNLAPTPSASPGASPGATASPAATASPGAATM